jgi:hypothetical protein
MRLRAQRETAVSVLREAADTWANGGPLEPTMVLAVFLRALSTPVDMVSGPPGHGTVYIGHLPNCELRPLETWLSAVVSPDNELQVLLPMASEAQRGAVLGQLVNVMVAAAEAWRTSPGLPSPQDVSTVLARELYDAGAARWWHDRGWRP